MIKTKNNTESCLTCQNKLEEHSNQSKIITFFFSFLWRKSWLKYLTQLILTKIPLSYLAIINLDNFTLFNGTNITPKKKKKETEGLKFEPVCVNSVWWDIPDCTK